MVRVHADIDSVVVLGSRTLSRPLSRLDVRADCQVSAICLYFHKHFNNLQYALRCIDVIRAVRTCLQTAVTGVCVRVFVITELCPTLRSVTVIGCGVKQSQTVVLDVDQLSGHKRLLVCLC